MINPELAHRAGTGEPVVYDLVANGWDFREKSYFVSQDKSYLHLILFRSPRMTSDSVLLENEWHNITEEHLKDKEKINILNDHE